MGSDQLEERIDQKSLDWITSIEYKNTPDFFEQIRAKINEFLEKDPRIQEKLKKIEEPDENILEAIKSNDFDLLDYGKESEEYGLILELTAIKNKMIADAIKFSIKNHSEKLGLTESEQIMLLGFLDIGLTSDSIYIKWRNQLYPSSLKEKIKKAKKNASTYLKNKELDNPYAIVIEKDGKYENVPYPLAFPEEYSAINQKLNEIINNLERISDKAWGKNNKASILNYIKSLKIAVNYSESRKENAEWVSVKLWKEVDKNWLVCKDRLQILHGIETGYERSVDPGECKSIPEYKILIRYELNEKMASNIRKMIKENTESLKKIFSGRGEAINSLEPYANSTVEIAGIVFGGGNSVDNIGVAQVGPNYEDVTKLHGCKSFVAYADLFNSEELRETIAERVFGQSETQKNLQHINDDDSRSDYVIEFIASHEVGHNFLGMDAMNGHLEEAKATWTGLIGAYDREQNRQLSKGTAEKILKAHLKYCLKYLTDKEDDDYKKEGIANLKLFLQSGLITKTGNQFSVHLEKIDDTYLLIKQMLLHLTDSYLESQTSENAQKKHESHIENLIRITPEVSEITKLAKKGVIDFNRKKKHYA